MRQFIKLWTSIAILTAAFYSGFAAAHGKVTLETDACMRDMSGSMIHLSTYQPQHDPEAEYCSEIPKEGETYWVIDLVDQALRDMPIVVKLVEAAVKQSAKRLQAFTPRIMPTVS